MIETKVFELNKKLFVITYDTPIPKPKPEMPKVCQFSYEMRHNEVIDMLRKVVPTDRWVTSWDVKKATGIPHGRKTISSMLKNISGIKYRKATSIVRESLFKREIIFLGEEHGEKET